MSTVTTKDGTQIYYKDLSSSPFFGANPPPARVSQGMIGTFWLQGMQAGHKNTVDRTKAFSETDFTEDLLELLTAHDGTSQEA